MFDADRAHQESVAAPDRERTFDGRSARQRNAISDPRFRMLSAVGKRDCRDHLAYRSIGEVSHKSIFVPVGDAGKVIPISQFQSSVHGIFLTRGYSKLRGIGIVISVPTFNPSLL